MKFTIRLRETVYHEAVVEAETRSEARKIARKLINDDDLEFWEVDKWRPHDH